MALRFLVVTGAMALTSGTASAQQLGPAPPPPPPPTYAAPPPEAPPSHHLQFEAQARIASGILSLAGLTPSLYLGIHYNRISVLLGIGMTNGSVGVTSPTFDAMQKQNGTATVTEQFTFISFVPTFAVDVLRSADEKAALYASIGIPLGSISFGTTSSQGMNNPCNSYAPFIGGYQIGIGARLALHPNFRLGFEAGPTGQFLSAGGQTCPGATAPTNTVSVSANSFYGSILGSFVWK
jgi:hypothetical protein